MRRVRIEGTGISVWAIALWSKSFKQKKKSLDMQLVTKACRGWTCLAQVICGWSVADAGAATLVVHTERWNLVQWSKGV
jgi:hypothetical protein